MRSAVKKRAGEPSKADDGTVPSAALIDDDLSGRSLTLPAAILGLAALLTAGIVVGLKYLPGSSDAAARQAVPVVTFEVDDPKAPGYVPAQLLSEVKLDWTGIGGSPYRGKVTVGIVVARTGEVTEVTVVKSLDPMIDGVAKRAARHLRFKPATRNGAPAQGRLLLDIPIEPF